MKKGICYEMIWTMIPVENGEEMAKTWKEKRIEARKKRREEDGMIKKCENTENILDLI